MDDWRAETTRPGARCPAARRRTTGHEGETSTTSLAPWRPVTVLSDDDVIRKAEHSIAAMTPVERTDLLHRRDAYCVQARDDGQGPRVQTVYKVEGMDQWRLVERRWSPLWDKDTYKDKPAWWLIF